jgi:hypothetical protein
MPRRDLDKTAARTLDRHPSIGTEPRPEEVARRLFHELRGQGHTPQQVRRIALALICATDAKSAREP